MCVLLEVGNDKSQSNIVWIFVEPLVVTGAQVHILLSEY